MREEYTALALQISRMFCLKERADINIRPEDRAEYINRFAKRLTDFTASYIDAQRIGISQFTQSDVALAQFGPHPK